MKTRVAFTYTLSNPSDQVHQVVMHFLSKRSSCEDHCPTSHETAWTKPITNLSGSSCHAAYQTFRRPRQISAPKLTLGASHTKCDQKPNVMPSLNDHGRSCAPGTCCVFGQGRLEGLLLRPGGVAVGWLPTLSNPLLILATAALVLPQLQASDPADGCPVTQRAEQSRPGLAGGRG